MIKKYSFNPDYGMHPGEILRDELEARGIEPDGEMQAVLDGGVLSDELAERLGGATGIGAHVWKNLMRQYCDWALKRIQKLFKRHRKNGELRAEEERELSYLTSITDRYMHEYYKIDWPRPSDIIGIWRDKGCEAWRDLEEVIHRLRELYDEGEILDWLSETEIEGKSVTDLILGGRVEEVMELLDRLEAGAYL